MGGCACGDARGTLAEEPLGGGRRVWAVGASSGQAVSWVWTRTHVTIALRILRLHTWHAAVLPDIG